MNADEIYRKIGQHVDAASIKAREPAEIWNSYFKFSITRNPWDRALSYFFWDRRTDPALNPRKRFYHYLGVPFDEFKATKGIFTQFLRDKALKNDSAFYVDDGVRRHRIPAEGYLENNDRFYTIDGDLCVDFVIRYENLVEDYSEVCKRIGIQDGGLPHMKGGIRKQKRPVNDYYNDETRQLVADLHATDLRLFDYRFEQE